MEKLIHLLIPRESNNHKAKILHTFSLFLITSLFILFQVSLSFFTKLKPNVLGYASSISRDEVVSLTNQKRSESGLPPLSLNKTLSDAAYLKGQDMITKDYWAHTAPDGTQPWYFFTSVGYKYKYAGENLARDFNNASSAVEAWMSSPSHRDNILSPKYKEIGIGIVEGDLAGSDTTIVVQFFGSKYTDTIQQPLAVAKKTEVTIQVTPIPTIAPKVVSTPTVKPVEQVLISPFTTTRTVSLSIVGLLLLVFIVDALIVSRRRIIRVAGRTFAHVAFLVLILSIIILLKSGKII